MISVQCQSQPAFRCRLQIQIYFPLIANGSLGLVRTIVKDANDTDVGQQSVTWVPFKNTNIRASEFLVNTSSRAHDFKNILLILHVDWLRRSIVTGGVQCQSQRSTFSCIACLLWMAASRVLALHGAAVMNDKWQTPPARSFLDSAGVTGCPNAVLLEGDATNTVLSSGSACLLNVSPQLSGRRHQLP